VFSNELDAQTTADVFSTPFAGKSRVIGRKLYESAATPENEYTDTQFFGGTMPLSGEAIRLMNYVDDVTTTLRRILALAPTLTPEERKRLSDYLRNADPNADQVMAALDVKESK
jgi:hypothetical protein